MWLAQLWNWKPKISDWLNQPEGRVLLVEEGLLHTYTPLQRSKATAHQFFRVGTSNQEATVVPTGKKGYLSVQERVCSNSQFQRRMKRSQENQVVPGEVGSGKTFLKRCAEQYAQSGQKCQETVFHGPSCHLFEQISHLPPSSRWGFTLQKTEQCSLRKGWMVTNLADYCSTVCRYIKEIHQSSSQMLLGLG